MARAIILAAGRGSRMGAATEFKPKCLTKLQARPLIEWQLESLAKAGIKNIELVLGYRSELLREYGSNYYVNKDWASTNMVSSLFCAPPSKADTIISYSDIVYNTSHIKKLIESPHDICITADLEWLKLWSLRFENPLDDAESFVFEKNQLLSIGKSTDDLDEINAQFMGLLKLSANGWNMLTSVFDDLTSSEQRKLDMTSLLNRAIERNISIHVEFINGKWCECDTWSDVLIYEKEVKSDNWLHDWR